MGVGAGLYSLHVRCCRKFTFAMSSPDEFLLQLRETDSSFVFIIFAVFGRPFVKQFALCYRTVVCLSCPVCDVGVLWPII